YEEGEKVILKEATKEGYKFLGWYKDGELVTEVKEGNVTVEARFEEIKNQDSEKKGCNCKKTIEMVITLTSAVTLLAFVLRKKH
ncbi:MAG: InlB B-repeat-containing protein, partial [Bacilli bacterium]|nr:InlB B-repeat-containing protein [Bacilli bacterium]